jgi:hypothetical protein
LSLCASIALSACSNKASHVDLTIHLDPPLQSDSGTDTSCIGVVGFEVTISSKGNSTSSGPVLNPAAVVTLDQCGLSRPAAVPNLDTDVPAIVIVTGHDGNGDVRVRANAMVTDFGAGSQRLALGPYGPDPPVVVLDKRTLTGLSLSDIANIDKIDVVATMGPPTPLVSGDRSSGGAYFDVDPTAFGSTNLMPNGASAGTKDVIFTMRDGSTLRKRIMLTWQPSFSYYEGKP